ncbi:LppM family (lipo)protein [Demequina sp. NBRC 110054]|uniref:LppM family (lipo)protein n=1 Tax=Demequina sp. NBRC 110054 TaxID=1570343 RepID=UPI000A043DA4|nr:hypothetical protein [Demequina sp. NBRC 110054]
MNATLTRAGKAIAVALFATLALTGCIKVDFELVLQPDDTVDGSITYAIAEGSGDLMSDDETTYSDEELLESLFGDIDASEYANGVLSDFTEDDWVGKTITFEGEDLAGFSLEDDTEGVAITREGDEFVVSGPYSSSEDDMTEGMDGAEMTMSITFPGEITETNGELSEDKHTVTWDLLDPPESLEARGGATEGSDFPMWMIFVAIAVVAVVAVAVVVLVLVNRSGKKKAVEAAAADEATAMEPAEPAAPSMLPEGGSEEEATDVAETVVIPDVEDEPFEPVRKGDDAVAEESSATESTDDAVADDAVADEPAEAEAVAVEEAAAEESEADATTTEVLPTSDEDEAPAADEDGDEKKD